jgi:hypothetical protein
MLVACRTIILAPDLWSKDPLPEVEKDSITLSDREF